MSLFLLHNGKIGRIVTCPIAVMISISYGNPAKVAFKESLKESQYLSYGSNFRISKS